MRIEDLGLLLLLLVVYGACTEQTNKQISGWCLGAYIRFRLFPSLFISASREVHDGGKTNFNLSATPFFLDSNFDEDMT